MPTFPNPDNPYGTILPDKPLPQRADTVHHDFPTGSSFAATFAMRPAFSGLRLLRPGRRVPIALALLVGIVAVGGGIGLTVAHLSAGDNNLSTYAEPHGNAGAPASKDAAPSPGQAVSEPDAPGPAAAPDGQGAPAGGADTPSTGAVSTTTRSPTNTATANAATTANPGNILVSQATGRCIDITGGAAKDGSPLEIRDCDGAASQRWTFGSDGTLRSLGLCMDVAWGSTSDGAVIQVARCNGGPAQQWVLSSAGDLVNPQANKCVDVKDKLTSNGTRLQLWTCVGTPNQKWSRA
jgi:hypothetical protein